MIVLIIRTWNSKCGCWCMKCCRSCFIGVHVGIRGGKIPVKTDPSPLSPLLYLLFSFSFSSLVTSRLDPSLSLRRFLSPSPSQSTLQRCNLSFTVTITLNSPSLEVCSSHRTALWFQIKWDLTRLGEISPDFGQILLVLPRRHHLLQPIKSHYSLPISPVICCMYLVSCFHCVLLIFCCCGESSDFVVICCCCLVIL